MKIRPSVILPILMRNLSSYFSGVLGYLFIVVFVVAGGALAFDAEFFTANEPSLDQLTEWFPMLLLFFVPALTMGVWAEERKSGTDELLYTLPATNLEILLGKYLSVVAVYTMSLLSSLTYVVILEILGDPDWGLLTSTYFGYWLAGVALLAAGMLASMLTTSMTVAFVLGIALCGIPVFLEYAAAFLGARELFESLSLSRKFQDFGMGIVPLDGLLYFVSLTVVMLYLNLVVMSKRLWPSDKKTEVGLQFSIRTVSLAVTAICLTSWAGVAAMRVDLTSERLFSLSPASFQILDSVESERHIEIQAYISPEVPREYVETRKRLVGLLRQFEELSGGNLSVRIVDVEPFSEAANEARHFGITPVQLMTEVDGRRQEAEVFLGAVVISSYDKVVVPFFGKGIPVEYELTRSIQTVAQEERKTVGILGTDANVMSGNNEWQIVTELKKQYEVVPVSADLPISTEDFDVLIAVMPSSLTDPQMDNLVAYVSAGNPALIFDDPFPLSMGTQFGVTGAPRQPKPSPGGQMGMMGGGGAPPQPKADGGQATRLLKTLGIQWQYDRVAFDVSNPHPEITPVPADEFLFLTTEGGNEDAFNLVDEVSAGMQEMLAIYAGSVSKDSSVSGAEVTALVSTGPNSGLLEWQEFVDDSPSMAMMMGGGAAARPQRDPIRTTDTNNHVIAAKIKRKSDEANANAIFVADVDMISDWFFQERTFGNLEFELDNVTFVLNAVDSLAEVNGFISLRSRRASHRSLKRVEDEKSEFLKTSIAQRKIADEKAEEELEKAQERLSKRVKEIEEDDSLDPLAKQQMLQQAQQDEQQKLSLMQAQIEQDKNDTIRQIDMETNREVAAIEAKYRRRGIWLPPLPALIAGVLVLLSRIKTERNNVVATRRR
ncbi:MAG: ABC transporter permease [Planctomycetaceae bacterium]|nr:ABC transporter permease [Planctomycetaceae bacterium]